MSDFMIRPPLPTEAEALADLHLRTWEETYRGRFPSSAWGEDARQRRIGMWETICTAPQPDHRVAVAERDGKLIGFAGAGPSEDDPAPRPRQLFYIYLLVAEQGSGAGQALLDDVLGTEPASLWVLENNPRTEAFYARNGFIHDGSRKPSGFEGSGDAIRLVR